MSGPRADATRQLIRGARLVGLAAASGLAPGAVGDVLVEDGRVARVAPSIDVDASTATIDARGRWLAPGLIDIQVNDIDWLARGVQSADAHAARARDVIAHQLARGVTGFVLATLAAPLEEIDAYLAGIARVSRDGPGPTDAALLGALVEGTFMNPAFHGAHNPRWVLEPRVEVLERFATSGAMRLINVAPEMGDEAIEVIRRATALGVVVGCGHAKPHARRVREAIDAGLRYVIHLGNGPTGSSLKAFDDGGLLEETLRNDALIATVIADGVHIHPALLRDWIVRKEPERVVAVSDAGFAMGPPRGRFEVFSIAGESVASTESPSGSPYLRVARDEGLAVNPHASDAAPLFGSAVSMLEVLETLIGVLRREMSGVHTRRHEALSLEAAVELAVRLTSTHPARLLGERERGELRIGARADLVLFELTERGGTERGETERGERERGERERGEADRPRVRVDAVWLGGARTRPLS